MHYVMYYNMHSSFSVMTTGNRRKIQLDIHDFCVKEQIALTKQIKDLKIDLDALPRGTLSIGKSARGQVKFYHVYYDPALKKRVRKYIPVENRKFAEQLAIASYLRDLIREKESELICAQAYLQKEQNRKSALEELERHCTVFQELVIPYIQQLDESSYKWQNAIYKKCSKYPEKKTVRAVNGEMVRSKSEAIILGLLLQKQLPYRYECQLLLGNREFYPDFTILHPETHEIVYFEHFGMMDDRKYADEAFSKLQYYNEHGIIQSHNLIATFETADKPLDLNYVDMLLTRHFT